MKTIISMRVATSMGYSSNDVTLYKGVGDMLQTFIIETPVGVGPNPGREILEICQDKFIQVIYLKPDQKFAKYTWGNDIHKTEPFLNHVGSYIKQGWSKTRPKAVDSYYSRYQKARAEEAKMLGRINWKNCLNQQPTAEELKGGFSPIITEEPEFIRYTQNSVVFGWLGSMVRTAQADKIIEKELLAIGLEPHAIVTWLTSTDGRHFGDYIAEFPINKQAIIIKQNIAHIFNKATVYAHPEHLGSLKSTREITAKLQDQLLPEKPTEYTTGQYWRKHLDK